MTAITDTQPETPKPMLWTGWILTGLVIAFMLLDAGMKLMQLDIVNETGRQLGLPESTALPIGVIELICLVLYAAPRTATLGAILLTAVMGGAIATHLRVGSPLLSHTLFGVYLGLMVWGGVWLRDPRLRSLIPLRSGR